MGVSYILMEREYSVARRRRCNKLPFRLVHLNGTGNPRQSPLSPATEHGGFTVRSRKISAFLATFFPLAATACLLTLAVADSTATQPPAKGAPGARPQPTKSPEPVQVVDDLHAALLTVMRHADELGYRGRYEKLEPVLRRTLDLDFMGSKAAGRHWKSFTPEQQHRWLDAFSRLTLANYAGRFNGYSGQRFETLGSEPAPHDTVLVRTRLLGGEEDVQLNYRLRETDVGWRVIDIYMHGTVSELALRRAEYSTAIERKGLDKVVAEVEAKIHDLETGSKG